MLRGLRLLVIATFVLHSTSALADDVPDTTHAHGLDLLARGSIGFSGAELATSAAWRISPRVALGALFALTVPAESHNAVYTYGVFNEEKTTLYRLGPHARWDYHSSRWTRAWLGAEIGPQLAVERGLDGGSPGRRTIRNEVGISVGAEAGFAVHPLEPLSLGISLEALGGSITLNPPVFAGLNLGVHIPVGESIPR